MCYPKVLLLFGGKTRRIYTSFFSLAKKGVKGLGGKTNKPLPRLVMSRWSGGAKKRSTWTKTYNTT
jgi:hypothetical protein